MKSLIEKAINRYLALDPHSHDRLNSLRGKIILLKIRHVNITYLLEFSDHGILFLSDKETPADIMIEGTPLNLLHMTLDKNNRRQFFAEDISVEGNMELAQQVIDLFDKMEIDWEENISEVLGDVTAHQLGRFARSMKQFNKNIRETLAQNINEYAHEEIDFFPTAEALQDFFQEVDHLRMETDRLEAKIKSLREVLDNRGES